MRWYFERTQENGKLKHRHIAFFLAAALLLTWLAYRLSVKRFEALEL